MRRFISVLVVLLCLIPLVSANVNDYNASLVLLMHMNQTPGSPTTFIDDSPLSKTITNAGTATTDTVIKLYGNASGNFTGASPSYLTVPDSGSYDFGTGTFTFSMWINDTSSSSATFAFVSGDDGTTSNGWIIGKGGGQFYYRTRGASYTYAPITQNEWQQFIVLGNGTYINVYRNGVLYNASAYGGNQNCNLASLNIGRNGYATYTYTKGYLEELAIWKGAEVPISYLYPQIDEIGYYNISIPIANFTCTPTTAMLGESIACTDTSSDTPTNWTYYWGDGNVTDGTQNPSYTYPFTGTFSINQTVNNTLGSSWYNRSNYITITNVSGFTQQDLWQTGHYTKTLHITDSATNAPIPVVVVTDSNGQSYTTTNGTAYFTEDAGAVVFYFAATGYVSKSMSYIIDGDSTDTVQMVASSPGGTQSTWYSPHQVRFAVVDSMGAKVVGSTINASAISTTMPTDGTADWLTKMYGIDPDAANDMMNGTLIMHGITQSDGATVFTMHSSIGYSLAVTNPSNGVVQTVNVTPIDTIYTIHLLGTAANNTYMDMGYNTSLYITEPDVHNVTMNLAYQDMSARTALLEFFVLARVNNTVINYQSTSSIGSDVILMNYTVPNVRPDRYSWYYNAVRVK